MTPSLPLSWLFFFFLKKRQKLDPIQNYFFGGLTLGEISRMELLDAANSRK